MKLLLMAALYYWGNYFLNKADDILYKEANIGKGKATAKHIESKRAKRINNVIEKHMQIEDYFKLHKITHA